MPKAKDKKLPKDKKLIIIAGPTASGKTQIAIEVAQLLKTEIVSFDSRQIFREMTIGTAVPNTQQLKAIKHHFIHSHSIAEDMNASRYANEATHTINQLLEKNNTVVVTGGTGMYMHAFLFGLDATSNTDYQLRASLEKECAEKGLEYLAHQLKTLDKKSYHEIDIHNPRRVIRALEIIYSSGKTRSSFIDETIKTPAYSFTLYVLNPDRQLLYENINNRVDLMIEKGLVDEARQLLPYRHLTALHTVGYKELFEYFDRNSTLDQAIEKIKQHTRNYAKRQLTWFRQYDDAIWITQEAMKKKIEEKSL